MLTIQTTGVEDFIDGSANIKALVIGGPGAGKTRMSSYWPKPIYLDAENGRGSLADRNMPYAEIHNSKDMLDALAFLQAKQGTPKGDRQFQTVVVDTVDSYQRLVKEEWVVKNQAAAFTGYDAWGYLDSKMQTLFTRLLNLDYNVIVLVHYTSKEHKDGDNTVREFTLQLQGAVKDQVFNDFDLVGWLGTYWAADGDRGKVQKRGLTFTPTVDKPFLKDRFNVTPLWMPIEFKDADYLQVFEAFFNRPELDALQESSVVGEIPDHDTRQPAPVKGVDGGPLPPREPVEVPLEKKLKGELETIAKNLGLKVRGNMLKDELVKAIKAEQAKRLDAVKNPVAGEITKGTEIIAGQAYEVGEGEIITDSREERPDPTSAASSTESAPAADAAAASSGDSAKSDASSGEASEETPPVGPEVDTSAEELVKTQLGGDVISREPADAPDPQAATPSTPVVQPNAPKGPSACAECGKDLAEEWADQTKRDYIRLSFVKNRRYLCTTCQGR